MSDAIGFISDVFGVVLATVGTTEITLGLTLAWALVIFLALSTFRRVRGR